MFRYHSTLLYKIQYSNGKSWYLYNPLSADAFENQSVHHFNINIQNTICLDSWNYESRVPLTTANNPGDIKHRLSHGLLHDMGRYRRRYKGIKHWHAPQVHALRTQRCLGTVNVGSRVFSLQYILMHERFWGFKILRFQ